MNNSYRQIMRSSSIIGGASIFNIIIGLLRTKIAATLLGPAGIGIIGLFQTLITTAATIVSMGLSTVGTRQIAEAKERNDAVAMATARRSLFWGSLSLAILGLISFWLLRETLANTVLHNSEMAGELGWLSIGVALTVVAGSQTALLNGLRRIADIASISLLSALISTVVGIAALMSSGRDGLLVFVLAAPLANFILGSWFASRLTKLRGISTPLPQVLQQLHVLLRLGGVFMIAGLVVATGHLIVRALIQRELGATSLGQFQAAWTVSMTYIGFVLQAMGTDFYPRLSAIIHEHREANRLINEQLEVALLFSGPILLIMLGLSPWIMDLLYSSDFVAGSSILRWQVLGDLLKIISWPFGFALLALGDGRAYILSESSTILIFVGLVWLGLPILGIDVTGMAFLAMYAIYLPIVYRIVHLRTGFTWTRNLLNYMVLLIMAASVVFSAASWMALAGAIIGGLLAAAFSILSLVRLSQMAGIHGPVRHLAVLGERAMLWLRKHTNCRKI